MLTTPFCCVRVASSDDDATFRVLLTAAREIRVELPLRKDDGTIVVYNAYRVQHHNARGPYKGGLRYHPDVDQEEIRGLACLMSLKTAVVDIALGGAIQGFGNVGSHAALDLLRRRRTLSTAQSVMQANVHGHLDPLRAQQFLLAHGRVLHCRTFMSRMTAALRPACPVGRHVPVATRLLTARKITGTAFAKTKI